ncbi:asparagine synthase-related protein [Halorubrum ezzemoulense]|uniref:asparagine synthase-related protein n=1 Tax=Halorubrum ezzemoulense TaxID=337243 RepID=UPI001181B5D6|nr:asparagine synthase-related protein [Halorubrum ezzemoulense]
MIDNLLFYGYNPGCRDAALPDVVRESVSSESISLERTEMINEGIDSFRAAIDAELKRTDQNVYHVVPLSSGLDSRAILAALLEHPEIEKSNIRTVSFGTPGTWDYEISQEIAESVGVRNTAMNLDTPSFDWSEASIRSYAKSLDCPTRAFEGYVNSKVDELFNDNYVIWSGFFGDPSAGGHQPDEPSEKWNEACARFTDMNAYAPSLVDSSFDPMEVLPAEPYLDSNKLSYEEQLDFGHRQQCFVRPLVIKNDTYLTPFMREEWLKYMLNIPAHERNNRSIFTDIFTENYPRVFSHPTDSKHGLPPNTGRYRVFAQRVKLFAIQNLLELSRQNPVHPRTNYIDFESKLRQECGLRTTVHSLVNAFEERTGYEVNAIWLDHQQGKNNAAELRSIASTELYLSESK